MSYADTEYIEIAPTLTGSARLRLIALALLTCALQFPQSAGAQPATVRLRQIQGCSFADDLNGLDMKNVQRGKMKFAIKAMSSALQTDASLGFVLYSPDGSADSAKISNLTLSPDWASPSVYWAPAGATLDPVDIDGILPDTWLITATSTGGGFQANAFVDVATFTLILPDNPGAVVCIDSAFVSPAGQWLMNPDGPPIWQAGTGDANVGGSHPDAFCISVFTGDIEPNYTTCVDSVTTSYCTPVSFQVTAVDPDIFLNRTVSYHAVHDGSGSVSVDALGNVTYTPVLQDTNQVITVTTFAAFPSTCSEGTPCVTKVQVTHSPPQANCDFGTIGAFAGDTVTLPPPFVSDPDSCEAMRWSLVSVTPTPATLVTIDSLTGRVTFETTPADIMLSYSIVIEVSDGFATSQCTLSLGFIGVLSSCCDVAGDADDSGQMNIGDVTFLIARIFSGGPAPTCCGKADVDRNYSVNIGDVTYLIATIFSGGPLPLCGLDFTSCQLN